MCIAQESKDDKKEKKVAFKLKGGSQKPLPTHQGKEFVPSPVQSRTPAHRQLQIKKLNCRLTTERHGQSVGGKGGRETRRARERLKSYHGNTKGG